ncbi:MAG: hypothetical protein WC222_05225 [Parachlamydiales bacterium]|jgi:hypothetical protein
MRTIILPDNEAANVHVHEKHYNSSKQPSVSFSGREYEIIRYEKQCKSPLNNIFKAFLWTLISFGFGLLSENIRHKWDKGLTGKNVKLVYIPQPSLSWDGKFLCNRDDNDAEFDTSMQKAVKRSTKCAFERINIASYRKNSGQVNALFAIDGTIREHDVLDNGRIRMDFMKFARGKCITFIAPHDSNRMLYWNSIVIKSRLNKDNKDKSLLIGHYLDTYQHVLHVMTASEISYVKSKSYLPPHLIALIREGNIDRNV